MRLLLIGNYALDRSSSMERYAEMLRRELTRRGHTVEVRRPQPLIGGLYSRGAIGKWLGYVDKYLLFPPRLRFLVRGWDWVHVCDQSNSMYLPYLPTQKGSITCHDVIAIEAAEGGFPEAEVGRRVSRTGRIQQAWIKKNLLRAERVVAVSQSTARRLQTMGATGCIRVIHNPMHRVFRPAAAAAVAAVRRSLSIPPHVSYLMHVGGNHWYKNRLGTLRIFGALREQAEFRDLFLVMAGSSWTTAMRDYIRAERLEHNVIEALDVSDAELESLYTGAEALLFPSLTEGFGWPVIEAQSCGTLVITSDRDTLREIAGEGAILIDPTSPESAANTIAEQWPQREAVRSRGVRNAGRFSSEALIDAYEEFFRWEPSTSWTP